ncbi:uncharacterized protein BDR25DRAFT_361596 [Lindgomyces ingoldianus]|uniref:Uncharacterized protein n=1 Tax=Lindgomyces ingoldianus TaxID=673940 RepID=A0ACB6QC26_9PLEO|nr:uncharacterized protein BDR25DRAFT_361596 [Lindgomyces ingoldianus]KAF2464518.1 hypothetical protein BDR25DRAFT_361596 [Lindgomyces ingoldianus]
MRCPSHTYSVHPFIVFENSLFWFMPRFASSPTHSLLFVSTPFYPPHLGVLIFVTLLISKQELEFAGYAARDITSGVFYVFMDYSPRVASWIPGDICPLFLKISTDSAIYRIRVWASPNEPRKLEDCYESLRAPHLPGHVQGIRASLFPIDISHLLGRKLLWELMPSVSATAKKSNVVSTSFQVYGTVVGTRHWGLYSTRWEPMTSKGLV